MAVKTNRSGVTVQNIFVVTITTCNSCMSAKQLEIGECVVEGGFVEFDNIEFPSFVFGVTGGAFGVLLDWKPAMKASLIRNVATNLHMTYDA